MLKKPTADVKQTAHGTQNNELTTKGESVFSMSTLLKMHSYVQYFAKFLIVKTCLIVFLIHFSVLVVYLAKNH